MWFGVCEVNIYGDMVLISRRYAKYLTEEKERYEWRYQIRILRIFYVDFLDFTNLWDFVYENDSLRRQWMDSVHSGSHHLILCFFQIKSHANDIYYLFSFNLYLYDDIRFNINHI